MYEQVLPGSSLFHQFELTHTHYSSIHQPLRAGSVMLIRWVGLHPNDSLPLHLYTPRKPPVGTSRLVLGSLLTGKSWLLAKARRGHQRSYQRAFNALCRLRRSRLIASRDIFLIYHQLQREDEIKHRYNRFVQLFSVGRNRRALVGSLIVMVYLPASCRPTFQRR